MNERLDLLVLRDVAVAVALSEDEELRQLGKTGIFDMPELAFAYAVGKAWTRRLHDLCPGRKVMWVREQGVPRHGITDLVMHVEGYRTVAVEFKMADRQEAYQADIEKLMRLQMDADRVLCLVVDAFRTVSGADPRIGFIETQSRPYLRRIGDLVTFDTRSPRYASPMSGVVGIWEVNPRSAPLDLAAD